MPDHVWWSKREKAQKAFGALPEGSPFLVFCVDRLVMVATHDYIMFCAGMLVEQLRASFIKIAAERSHYQSVVDALNKVAEQFKTVNDEIAKADEHNKLEEGPSVSA